MAEKPASGRNFGGQNRQGTLVTDDAVSAWFIREILPLEANLMHYLQHNWRNTSDLPDLRQEVYARVLESAQERIPDNPENFLFVCARNLLIDLVRREQVVPMDSFADLDALGVASGAPQPDRLFIEREDIRRLEEALVHLPPRIREAIALAYFEGLSRVEIAKRMGISHQTASEYITRGTYIIADILFGKSQDGNVKS
jgi:RNA polymerase sigma-70 factor (ECF subfamily)